MDYKPWIEALEREVRGLNLDDFQWLELLEARTEGEALQLIKENRIMTIEDSPEHSLRIVWNTLHQRFHTEDRPSHQLLKELQQGTTISSSDASKLFTFAQRCNNIANLQQTHPATLNTLNDQATQDLIIERLDVDLNSKWFEHCRQAPRQ